MKRLLTLWLVCAGCLESLPRPVITDVSPGLAAPGMLVVVSGEHFYASQDWASGAQQYEAIRDTFDLLLATEDGQQYSLSNVEWESSQRLNGTIPVDGNLIPPNGEYCVQVRLPNGRLVSEPFPECLTGVSSFQVSTSVAQGLDIQTDSPTVKVNKYAQVTLTVMTGDGQPAPLPNQSIATIRIETEDPKGLRSMGFDNSVGFFSGEPDVTQIFDDGLLVANEFRGLMNPVAERSFGFSISSNVLTTVTAFVEAPESVELISSPLDIQWASGDDLTLEFDLSSLGDPPTIFAGESKQIGVRLVDENNNSLNVDEYPPDLVIAHMCERDGGQLDQVGFSFLIPTAEAATVSFTRATGGDCRAIQLAPATPIDPNSARNIQGLSQPIQVLPGELAGLRVEAPSSAVRAGELVILTVTPEDDYGNQILDWTDQIDSVSFSSTEEADFVCESSRVPFRCTGTLIQAANDIVATVSSSSAQVDGSSSVFDVLPERQATHIQLVAPAEIRAGLDGLLEIVLLDSFGNPASFQENGVDLEDDSSDVTCVFDSTTPQGTELHRCTSTLVGNVLFTVTSDSLIDVASVPLVNGPIHTADWTLPSVGVAGEPISLEIALRDAYGNPVSFPTTATYDLVDVLGPLMPDSVGANAQGVISTSVVQLVAGETSWGLVAEGGGYFGSPSIEIQPAVGADLSLSPQRDWFWAGEVVPLVIRVQDSLGNAADIQGVVDITSDSGDVVATASMVDGLASVDIQWAESNASERLHASINGFTASTGTLLIVEDCGGLGPAVSVAAPAHPGGRVCTDGGVTTQDVILDFSGSGGPNPLDAILVNNFGQADLLTQQIALSMNGSGSIPLQVLVVDANQCASESEISLWLGEPGDAVGEIDLLASAAANQNFSVQVTAQQCDDSPYEGPLTVFASAGVIGGASSTGAGLEVPIVAGVGLFNLDTEMQSAAGFAELLAWNVNQTAFGSTVVEITQDRLQPRIWDVRPRGQRTGLIDEVLFVLSEPLDGYPTTAVNISSGTTAANLLPGVFDPQTQTLSFGIDPPIDASSGAWSVTVIPTWRDVSGNLLDGNWVMEVSGTEHQSVFGMVSNETPILSCEQGPVPAFHPDGDPGVGFEADEVNVRAAIINGTTPSKWRLEVLPEGSALGVQVIEYSTAAEEITATWDGRRYGGLVAPVGVYELYLSSEDESGNRSAPCIWRVNLMNRGSSL